MKKLISILVLSMVITILSACSSDNTTSNEPSQSQSEISYASMIANPNSIFTTGNITVTDPDGGTAYIFEVTNFNDGEFETYISECKTLGFDDVSYDSETDFGAYSSDGSYWLQVNLDNDKEVIYVICQESKK